MSSPEAKQFAPMPTKGEMAGAIGQTALMAFPGQTVAKGVAGVASKFIGAGASKLAGSVASLGGAGYGFDVSKNLEEGKTGLSAAKPGFGAALGAIPLVGAGASKAKSGIQKIGADQAPRIINSLIKPLQKDFAYGKNPGRAVAGIKADNFDDLVTKISQSRQKAGQEIGDLGKKLEGKVVLSLQDTLLPINDAMETAAKQNNATLLQRLASVKRSITENLKKGLDEAGNPTIVSDGLRNLETATFKEARDIMRAIGDVTAFTGNPSDDKLVNSALKRVYGQMKGKTLEAAEKADPAIAKLFRKATERYGDLTSAEIAAKYRDKILERQNITSFGQTTVGLGGALATAIATGGAAVPTILAGLGAAGLQKALGSTAFKTRLAAWLVKIPTGEKATILQKFPQLQEIMNTRTPGDVFLDSKLGGKVKESVKNMKGKGGLSIQDVSKNDPLLKEAGKYKSAQVEANDYAKKLGEKYNGRFGEMTSEESATLSKLNSEVDRLAPKKAPKTPSLPGKNTGTSEDIITGTEYFHATTPDRLDSIIKDGLSISQKARGVNGGGQVFVADTPKHALGFMNDLKLEGAISEGTSPILLRVRDLPHEKLTQDVIGRHNSLSSGTAWSYSDNVPAKYLEIKKDGKWIPLTDLYNKAQGSKRGFGTGAGRPKSITKAQDKSVTKNSLQEVLQDGAKEYIKILEKAKTIDFDAVQKYQDLLKRAPKITDIASLTRNIAELERKSKLKLMDEATKIRDEVFDGIRKRNLKK